MSKENKGREFELENRALLGNTYLLADELGDDADNVVYGPNLKVIEYSAFEKCQAEKEKLNEKYQECVALANKHAGEIVVLREKLAVAVKALEYYAQNWHNKDQELSAFKSRKALKQIEEMGK